MKHPSRYAPLFSLRPTHHYLERAAHRCLRDEVRDFILRHGIDIRAAGATHLVVIERRLPVELRGTEAARRARDWIVVLGDDGALITCYRRKRAVHFVRRKAGQRPVRSGSRLRETARTRTHHQGGRGVC